MTGRVVVVGSLNIDLLVQVPRHPEPGETVLGGDLRRLPGGKGANQALAAARAGADVHLVGRVGDDADGRAYLTGLDSRGVETSYVRQTADEATGTALITVSGSGENTIVVAPGANSRVRPEDVDEAADAIRGADVLLVQLEIPVETVVHAVGIASRAGVRVVANPSPVQDVPRVLLDAADPAVVNEHEARLLGLTEASIACITHGAAGATWKDADVPSPPADAIDTTGAGDVFAGTLAAGLASGSAGPDGSDAGSAAASALRTAVAAASSATTWRGAQGWRLG